MNIMGFSAYGHTSSAALIVDGKIVAAAEEERFLRRKYSMALPLNAARYCLAAAGLEPDDLHKVVYFFDLKLGLPHYLAHALRHFPSSLKLLTERKPGPEGFELVINPWRTFRMKRFFLGSLGAMDMERIEFKFMEHHFCHAAHYLASPYEEAAVLTADALGEWTSTAMYKAEPDRIVRVGRVCFPHSLGAVYAAVTTHLGFGAVDGPGKIMGLAGYGDPKRFGPDFEQLFLLKQDGGFEVDLSFFEYHKSRQRRVSKKFEQTFCPPRTPGREIEQVHADLAAALQAALEGVMLHMARWLHDRTGLENLVLAGGVALNSLCNARLAVDGPFRSVYVPPSPGDSGTALGSALAAAVAAGDLKERALEQPYLGPEYSSKECEAAAIDMGLSVSKVKDPVETVVDLLKEGKLVGWFQSRMEFGPRALGNRSILADPSRPGTRDRLNERVKGREGFRPFAPACLDSDICDLFETPRSPSPFMSFVYKAKPEVRKLLKEALHVDFGARVQSVSKDSNPLFHRLVKTFKEETGVPGLLNTSFNASGEPIVCSPQDAVRCFENTGLDALIMQDVLVQRT